MKQVSDKRRALNDAVRPWRQAIRDRVKRCEHCLKRKLPSELDVDEIARGSCRAIALTAEYAVLVVCRLCHRKVQDWSRARRLALLMLARPAEYCLEKFWALTKRNWPDQEDVDREAEAMRRERLGTCSQSEKSAKRCESHPKLPATG
jgi:hypothetical protein